MIVLIWLGYPLLYAVQAFIAFYNVYQIGVSLFGLKRRVAKREHPPGTRFAFLVAAHNEEAVIAGLVDSLKRQHYPKELYDVWVVADNCTDCTATTARIAGANVLERFDADKRGKNHAIRHGLDRLLPDRDCPDAAVIVDADNLVHPDFLSLINEDFLRGSQVVQGYLGTKNPDDSMISRLYYLTYTLSNRNWQLARKNAGLVCALGGTGMCIGTNLLRQIGWHPQSLTEDLEFTVQAYVEAGERSVWNHDAIIYDEKPTGFWQSMRQRERWMRGHVSVARRYVLTLLGHFLRTWDWRAVDLALYLLSPFRMMFTGLSLVLALIGLYFTMHGQTEHFLLFSYQTWFEIFGLQIAYPLLYLVLERVSLRRLSSFIMVPLWGLTWIPLAVSGLLRSGNKTWNHTLHRSRARIDDVIKK